MIPLVSYRIPTRILYDSSGFLMDSYNGSYVIPMVSVRIPSGILYDSFGFLSDSFKDPM